MESGVIGNDKIPVHHIPEFINVFDAGIAVIDVIGVFPDITG